MIDQISMQIYRIDGVLCVNAEVAELYTALDSNLSLIKC